MSNPDQKQRFLFTEADVRGEWVGLDQSFQQMLKNHRYPAAVRRLLGELSAAVVLLSSNLKFSGKLSIHAKSQGPVRLIAAECTQHQEIRAMAQCDEGISDEGISDEATRETAFSELAFPDLLKDGILAITIDPDEGERYQGIVPLSEPTLAACLEHYFQQSEQLQTRLLLAADDTQAAGLLLQRMPGSARDSDGEQWNRLQHLAATLSNEELLAESNATLLRRLFHEEPLQAYPASDIRFACSCSRQRVENALISLGQEELTAMQQGQDQFTIDCEFCGEQYRFSATDIALLARPDTLH